MDKHTFKVGDRVKSVGYVNSRASGVELGVVNEVHTCGVEVNFDRKEVNREGKDKWYLDYKEVQHDTDFQVGDWVRYEGVEDGHVPELEGEVGIVTCARGFSAVGVKFPAHWNPDALWNKANLVKIQPPQEEKKNMRNVFSITHEKYGVVQGVHQVAPGCYCKNGAHYYHGEGWRETEEWVKIEVRKSQWDNVNKCCNVLEVQKKSEDYPDTCTLSWRYPK